MLAGCSRGRERVPATTRIDSQIYSRCGGLGAVNPGIKKGTNEISLYIASFLHRSFPVVYGGKGKKYRRSGKTKIRKILSSSEFDSSKSALKRLKHVDLISSSRAVFEISTDVYRNAHIRHFNKVGCAVTIVNYAIRR